MRLHRGVRPRRGIARVEILGQPARGDDLAMRRDQPGQHTPLPGATATDGNTADGHLQGPEHPNRDHWHLADDPDLTTQI